jgi:hypothetical protein
MNALSAVVMRGPGSQKKGVRANDKISSYQNLKADRVNHEDSLMELNLLPSYRFLMADNSGLRLPSRHFYASHSVCNIIQLFRRQA